MENLPEPIKFLGFSSGRRNEVFELKEKPIPYLDLTYCLEGTMEYFFEGQKILLTQGDAILYPQNSVRKRCFTVGINNYASFNVEIPANFTLPVKGHIRKCVRPDTVQMLELFKSAYESDSMMRIEKCTSIFMYLYCQLIENALDTEHSSVKDAKQYILLHISEKITLDDIAHSAHVAKNYLCSLFKKNTGVTVTEYIALRRVEKAKALIVTENVPLYAISGMCGFNDYNHFSQTFKRITGMTPVSYRKVKV